MQVRVRHANIDQALRAGQKNLQNDGRFKLIFRRVLTRKTPDALWRGGFPLGHVRLLIDACKT